MADTNEKLTFDVNSLDSCIEEISLTAQDDVYELLNALEKIMARGGGEGSAKSYLFRHLRLMDELDRKGKL